MECLRDLFHDIINYLGVLVGNKIDLDQRRRTTPKMGRDFAESNGLEYFECSAVSISVAVLYYYHSYLEEILTDLCISITQAIAPLLLSSVYWL